MDSVKVSWAAALYITLSSQIGFYEVINGSLQNTSEQYRADGRTFGAIRLQE